MAVEFGASITFGRYLSHASLMHRADPRVKLLAVSALAAAMLATRDAAALTVAAGGVLAYHLLARVSWRFALSGLRLLLTTLALVSVLQVLFAANPSNPWWQYGILSLSADGLRNAGITAARVILVYHLSSLLLFTTTIVDLADGLEQLGTPLKRLGLPVHELTLTFTIALRFVPLLVNELERLVRAQAARGLLLEQRPTARVRQLARLLIPLFVRAFARADLLTQALDARCYRGGGERTRRRTLQLQRSDRLLLIGALACACTSLVLTWT
jgi:energy-coupling factor transport system permease protein